MAMSKLVIDDYLALDNMTLQELWDEANIQWFHWGVHKSAQKDHRDAIKHKRETEGHGAATAIRELDKELEMHKNIASVFHGNGDRCLEHYYKKVYEEHGQHKADAERDRLHSRMHKAAKAGETHNYVFFKDMGSAHP